MKQGSSGTKRQHKEQKKESPQDYTSAGRIGLKSAIKRKKHRHTVQSTGATTASKYSVSILLHAQKMIEVDSNNNCAKLVGTSISSRKGTI